MKRLKVLISAYACEPGKGSEPGMGWNVVEQMSNFHDIWVITRVNNRPLIEKVISDSMAYNVNFIYFDLPVWARFWKRGVQGVQVYYYLWQVAMYFKASQLHREVGFDLIHHVTFMRYWTPSLLSLLPVPFLWGPVGGGESAPKRLLQDSTICRRIPELARNVVRKIGDWDPLVRRTIKNSSLILTTTDQTTERLARLGAERIHNVGGVCLAAKEVEELTRIPYKQDRPFRFISLGRLLFWKGFHLGLQAFGVSELVNAEYWIVGDGPEFKRLRALAMKLGIASRVHFWGKLSRNETMEKLADSHVLVHPSLHDSSGSVCLEAMAAGRPIICLDCGGPGMQVTQTTGFKIYPETTSQTVHDMAKAMVQLEKNPALSKAMGEAGRARVRSEYVWDSKRDLFNSFYNEVVK